MTTRPLHAVLRALADTGPPESDAELLRRFAATRDDEAFATLVRRHGRLVWAVCRHLCRTDAEADDAFQATFLVLVRNAGSVRDAGKLSAWLHGVAYKVCRKAQQSAKRRAAREQATAHRERNGHAVPDSAWDRALEAVHEEVAGLPDTLRVPFVLCCLEGKGQTEAAEQLGWKLGTFSGRLTRAKDAVLAKLNSRGLTLGVLSAFGLAAVPAGVSAKAVELGQVGFAVPGSILQLSHGVIGMSVHKVKLLAAGVLAACGLAVSGGAGWVASAGAQPVPAKVAPADKVKQLEAELARAKEEAARAAAEAAVARDLVEARRAQAQAELEKALAAVERAKNGEKDDNLSTKRWQYEFEEAKPMSAKDFVQYLGKKEASGWEFAGTTPMVEPKMNAWVFRKPKAGSITYVPSVPGAFVPPGEDGPRGITYPTGVPGGPGGMVYRYYTEPAAAPTAPKPPLAPTAPSTPGVPPTPPAPPAPAAVSPVDNVKDIEAEIRRLQEKLAVIKKLQGKTADPLEKKK